MKLLYVTASNEQEAANIAQHLLKKKLVACANILQSRSLYRWKGDLRDEREAVLLLKTTTTHAERAKEEIRKKHSYEVPCIIEIDGEALPAYEAWLREQVR